MTVQKAIILEEESYGYCIKDILGKTWGKANHNEKKNQGRGSRI